MLYLNGEAWVKPVTLQIGRTVTVDDGDTMRVEVTPKLVSHHDGVELDHVGRLTPERPFRLPGYDIPVLDASQAGLRLGPPRPWNNLSAD